NPFLPSMAGFALGRPWPAHTRIGGSFKPVCLVVQFLLVHFSFRHIISDNALLLALSVSKVHIRSPPGIYAFCE
ncbi:MAG: hypothetical protein JXJ04_21680, partial [Spirochaetales bacterium]|nr:hypothetical protein [Spirochaetales bacterium]